jgi:hypothetical protein
MGVPDGRDAGRGSSVGPVASGTGTDQEAVMLHRSKLIAGALGVLVVTTAIAVEATSGRAQVAGATYVITPVGKESMAFSDVKPKGFRHNRFSLGDQLFLSTRVKRDGTVAGTAEATITVSDPHALEGDRAHGVVSAVYHLADGDIYSVGTVLFDDSGTGRGAVVGGTGAYAGARGTVDPGHDRDVVHLLP